MPSRSCQAPRISLCILVRKPFRSLQTLAATKRGKWKAQLARWQSVKVAAMFPFGAKLPNISFKADGFAAA
ncbi:hypothetical protein ASD68_12700 [Rhodanobacter sp. Root627]|nr:hypothetical protein ASD68_12700 [Rhodanobacter sp. Root627]